MNTRFPFRLLALATLLAASGVSQATLVVYNTQASFLAAVSSPGVDTFQSLSITGSTPSPLNRTAGAYSYTAAASTSSFFGAGTAADHWLSTNIAADSITFNNFTSGVRGVGGFFFDSDINGAFLSGNITVSATDANGTVTQTLISATTTSFLGFVSTGALTSLTVAAVQGATPIWPTVNDFTLAAPRASVPEPASLALVALGLLGTLGLRRRA